MAFGLATLRSFFKGRAANQALIPAEAKAATPVEIREHEFGAQIEHLIEFGISGKVVSLYEAYQFYRKNAVLQTAVEVIAKKVENISPVLKTDDEIDTKHPVINFLKRPNDFMPWREFIGAIARHYLISGNFYMLANGVFGMPPREIYSIHPININPTLDADDGFPNRYDISSGIGRGYYNRETSPKDGMTVFNDGFLSQVYHAKGFTSNAQQLTGDIPLQGIFDEINQYSLGSEHNSSLLQNSGRLSMIFHLKQDLADDIFKKAKQKIVEQFTGAKNAGKVVVFGAKEAEVQELGVNPKDMDFVKLVEITIMAIYARFGIPLPIVSPDRQTFSNYETAVGALYDDAIIPVLNSIFEALSWFLLPRFGLDPREAQLTFDEMEIQSIRKRRLEEIKALDELHMITTNEKRAMHPDYEEIEGGDYIMAPATLQPMAGNGVDLYAISEEMRSAEMDMSNATLRQMENEGNEGGENDNAS